MRRYLRALLLSMLLALWCLALTGCTPTPHPDPVPPAVRVVPVDRVVATACIKAGQIPPVPARVGNDLNGSAAHDASLLAAADLKLRAWIDQAVALLQGCGG